MMRGRQACFSAAFLAVAGVVALGLAFLLYAATLDHPTDRPCPTGARAIHATETHLSPTVFEHQNWVGIPPSEIQTGQVLYICTDGRAIGEAVMDDEDVTSPVVVLNVPTHWVDAAWVSGSLDQYRQPDRWLVVFPPFASTEM